MSRAIRIDKAPPSAPCAPDPLQALHRPPRILGVVLDLSVSGLFIQTHAQPRLGERVRLYLSPATAPLELDVQVMRVKKVPPALMAPGEGRVRRADRERAQPSTIGCSPSSASARTQRRSSSSPSRGAGSASMPRSSADRAQRRVDVAAGDPDEAQVLALEELGSGWKVIRSRGRVRVRSRRPRDCSRSARSGRIYSTRE
jgi:hypothetical protein